MSLKMHYLHSHLDFLQQISVSDEQQVPPRYQCPRWDAAMMSDYFWFLMSESDIEYKRKSPFAK